MPKAGSTFDVSKRRTPLHIRSDCSCKRLPPARPLESLSIQSQNPRKCQPSHVHPHDASKVAAPLLHEKAIASPAAPFVFPPEASYELHGCLNLVSTFLKDDSGTLRKVGYMIWSSYAEANCHSLLFSSHASDHSYLWEKALDQYRKELKNSDDYEGIMGVDSMEELLSQTRSLEPPGAQSKTFLTSLNRLEPMLLHLNDFSAVTALFFGVNPKGAALVWGSLRIILSVLLCLLIFTLLLHVILI